MLVIVNVLLFKACTCTQVHTAITQCSSIIHVHRMYILLHVSICIYIIVTFLLLHILQLRSMILSPGDRKRVEEERKAQRLKRMEESNTRKKQMQDYELERKKNEKPSDLEQVKRMHLCLLYCMQMYTVHVNAYMHMLYMMYMHMYVLH